MRFIASWKPSSALTAEQSLDTLNPVITTTVVELNERHALSMLGKYAVSRDVTEQVRVLYIDILSVDPKRRTANGKVKTDLYTCSGRRFGKEFLWRAEWSPDKGWRATELALFAPGLDVRQANDAVGAVVIGALFEKVPTEHFELPPPMFVTEVADPKPSDDWRPGGTNAANAAEAGTTVADEQYLLDELLHKKGRRSGAEERMIRGYIKRGCVLPKGKKYKFLSPPATAVVA